MIALGFFAGLALGALVFFAIGFNHGRDVRVQHERADIRPALRRSR